MVTEDRKLMLFSKCRPDWFAFYFCNNYSCKGNFIHSKVVTIPMPLIKFVIFIDFVRYL